VWQKYSSPNIFQGQNYDGKQVFKEVFAISRSVLNSFRLLEVTLVLFIVYSRDRRNLLISVGFRLIQVLFWTDFTVLFSVISIFEVTDKEYNYVLKSFIYMTNHSLFKSYPRRYNFS
jgi:uncharacterized membrane protein YesL